ncbi:hypothetical protein K492DRAFT_26092 [Lichtheimia hyalospora FSU 10163]|nr:hypothetical protein K492DRAFT_26092 [Lichtheimia hyalospora FSU 10163]
MHISIIYYLIACSITTGRCMLVYVWPVAHVQHRVRFQQWHNRSINATQHKKKIRYWNNNG